MSRFSGFTIDELSELRVCMVSHAGRIRGRLSELRDRYQDEHTRVLMDDMLRRQRVVSALSEEMAEAICAPATPEAGDE